MWKDRPLVVARIFAEASASAHLDEVCRWLIESLSNPMRLAVEDVPALGQGSWLRLALPITAPRALLCGLWLLEDIEKGGCLLAGQLRFVAHPTESGVRMSFAGQSAAVLKYGALVGKADHAARQLLETIAASIAASIDSRPTPHAQIAS
jgi:hypothetical protein